MAHDLATLSDPPKPCSFGSAVFDVDRLPSVPAVYLELKKLLANPKAMAADVASVVQRDPAIAAKLLQLVNSALFPNKTPVSEVEVAVARLGMSTVQAVATCAAVFSSTAARHLPRGFDIDTMQSRAMRAGAIARRIAPGDSDVFIAALLAELGVLALATAAPEAYERLEAAGVLGRPREEARLIEADHAEIGAVILARWDLPSTVVLSVASHHELAHAPASAAKACGAVHVACARAEGREPDKVALINLLTDEALVEGWIARTI